MVIAGACEQVKSVDITDYNPKFEDFRTGLFLGNMLFYFCQGLFMRKNH